MRKKKREWIEGVGFIYLFNLKALALSTSFHTVVLHSASQLYRDLPSAELGNGVREAWHYSTAETKTKEGPEGEVLMTPSPGQPFATDRERRGRGDHVEKAWHWRASVPLSGAKRARGDQGVCRTQ